MKLSVVKHLSVAIMLSALHVIAIEKITVPHDVHPGYSIKKLHSKGQDFSLIENEFSPHFTIFTDGTIVPTTNLTHFVDIPVSIFVLEKFENVSRVRNLELYVKEREKMLRFPQTDYSGHILENEPVGSVVEIFGNLHPENSVGHLHYNLSGDGNLAFKVWQQDEVISIITTTELDREHRGNYKLLLTATDSIGAQARALLNIIVDDTNDHHPEPAEKFYTFRIPDDLPKYSVIGSVHAFDRDGDKPVYHFVGTQQQVFTIVPKTGEIYLIDQPDVQTYHLLVRANDRRVPPNYSDVIPVSIYVYSSSEAGLETDENRVLVRKRRSIRQTKTYSFAESDGNMPGRVIFLLESLHPDEAFN